MISNYLLLDDLSLVLFDDDLPHYMFLEEIEDVYSNGYTLDQLEYETVDVPTTQISFSDKEVEQEDYLLFEDLFSFENPLMENGRDTVIHPSASRVYSFFEDLIVHLMYGYLHEEEYPERDYLVYEEMDAIHDDVVFGEVRPIAVA